MPLHPDQIPTSEQVRETLLDRIYYPYKKQILAGATVLVVAILAILAVKDHQQRRKAEMWARYDAAFEIGREAAQRGDEEALRKAADERITALHRLVQDFPADPVTPYALTAIVSAQVDVKRYEEALQTLDRLRRDFKDFALCAEPGDVGPDGQKRSLAEKMEAGIRAEMKWNAETAYTHPQPKPGTQALVETTLGSFWIGFYEDQAPEHVAAFQANVKAGWYNGTQVYQVRQGGMPEQPTPILFEAGSAASKFGSPDWQANPSNRDRDEPGAVTEPEDARFLIHHLYGVVSAVSMASGESSRRFMVITAERGMSDRFDGQNTPFAAVLVDREGSGAVVNRITLASTYGTSPETKDDPENFGMRDHPYPPVWIRRISLWKDEKLEDGHSWDTSRAGTSQPEPWEADLPKPPLPSEFAPKREEPKEEARGAGSDEPEKSAESPTAPGEAPEGSSGAEPPKQDDSK